MGVYAVCLYGIGPGLLWMTEDLVLRGASGSARQGERPRVPVE